MLPCLTCTAAALPCTAPVPQSASLEDALRQLYVLDAIDENGQITGETCWRDCGGWLLRLLRLLCPLLLLLVPDCPALAATPANPPHHTTLEPP
jgi:hypothetical protein